MGDPETGAGQVRQQVSRDLQRREQTQAVNSHRADRGASRPLPGKMQLHCFVSVQLEYEVMSLVLTISRSDAETWLRCGSTLSWKK